MSRKLFVPVKSPTVSRRSLSRCDCKSVDYVKQFHLHGLCSVLGAALQEQMLAIRRRVLGERHPDTTLSAWNLVTTLRQIGESESAARILVECLEWLTSCEASRGCYGTERGD
jgi:Tetratricopeptide repeat